MEGGMKILKYIFFCINVIFCMCGIALIVIGILVQLFMHNTFKVKDTTASGAPILITAVGVLIFLVAFFGCCGALQENYCMVTAFSFILSLIIILEITAVVLGYKYRGKVGKIVSDSLAEMITNYNTSKPGFRAAVDKLQMKLKCCGINSTADWRSFSDDGNSVPDSCCMKMATKCGMNTMNNATIVYQKGCKEVFIKLFKDNLMWIIVASIVIAILQVSGVCVSCLLMKEIQSGYEVM